MSMHFPLLRRCLTTMAITVVLGTSPAHSNAQSQTFEMGTNLDSVTDFSTQLPFCDLFKMSREWYTQSANTFDTQEAARLNLDTDGWLRSLTPTGSGPVNFTRVCTLIFTMGAVEGGSENGKLPYPAGAYVVRYEGQGVI